MLQAITVMSDDDCCSTAESASWVVTCAFKLLGRLAQLGMVDTPHDVNAFLS